MAKSKRHLSRRKKVKKRKQKIGQTIYANKYGQMITKKGIVQEIYEEPQKVFVEKYLTPKGAMLLKTKQITKKDAWERYGKNRYRKNNNDTIVKEIIHIVN